MNKKVLVGLTAILLSVAFFSCGMSKSEKAHLESMIQLHNITVAGRFAMDSLKEMERVTIKNFSIHKEPKFNDYLRSHGIVYKNHWNEPYQISKDYKLTFDKYIEYCKANNKDPKTFYKFMN